METLFRDVRFAIRRLAGKPLFTTIACAPQSRLVRTPACFSRQRSSPLLASRHPPTRLILNTRARIRMTVIPVKTTRLPQPNQVAKREG